MNKKRLSLAILTAISFSITAPQTKAPTKVQAVTVNELAANPKAHLGRVTIVGVVGVVNAKKGFVLIDSREFKECGLSCLSESGTKKIPVQWTGAAPKVTQPLRVDGTLAKTSNGYSFVADKLGKA